MVVEQDGGQRRGIDLVFLCFRNLSRQLRVQCMDTLHHQHLVTLQLQFLATHLTLPRLEIIAGQFHLLPTEQCVHLLVEQRDVQRMQMLIVVIPFLVTGVFSRLTK